jgi:hypothetical protein
VTTVRAAAAASLTAHWAHEREGGSYRSP